MAFRTCGPTSAVAGVKWRRYVNHVRGASSHHYSFPSAQWKIENRWLVASHLTILVLDVIHRGVILMACVFLQAGGPMQSPAAGPLQAELHRSSGAKKRRHQDDKAEWYTAIPKLI